MSTEQKVEQYVDFIQDSAQELRDLSISYAQLGAQPNTSVLYGSRPAPVVEAKFIESNPAQYNPIQDLRGEFESKYYGLVDKLDLVIPQQFRSFKNEFFPTPKNKDGTDFNLEQYLLDGILNGGIGLPATIEQQLWDQARDRELYDAQRLDREAIEMSANNGFYVAPEVVKYRRLIAKNQASRNISETNRQIAIEVAKMRVDWIKFAIQQLADTRKVALDAAMNYIGRMLAHYDTGLGFATGYVNSYRTFYEAYNAYYDSISKINQLSFQVADANARYGLETAKLNDTFVLSDKQRRTSALIDTARSLGSQAASALSSINSLVSLQASSIQNI